MSNSEATPFEVDTLAMAAARARTMTALFGDDPGTPRRIAGYAVLDVLGRGAMGVVYLAHDDRLDRSVALKLIDPGRRDDPRARDSLVAEAKQIARVQHANVVAVYEVGSHDGDTFLAMEYVAGPTLREWTLGASHSTDEILRMFIGAGRGLAAVHEAGLLHRDFKPSNVLVTADAVAKVADFGLARRDDSLESADERPTLAPERTHGSSERIAGTPAYMAPEQILGTTTARADQFAFGVALLEALCGEHPFERRPSYAISADEARRRLDLVARPRLPGWLFAILRRAVAWDPSARWPDMGALVAALDDAPSRRRGRVIARAAAIGVVVLIGAGGYAWSRERAQRCSGARERIADAWGQTQRDQVRAAVLGTAVPYAETAWRHAELALDAYADEWVQRHTDACEATTVRGEQSTQVMDLRMGCLQRAETKLVAVTDVLAEVDADAVARIHELTGGLPPLSRCSDVEALQAEVEPPLPEQAPAVQAVRSLIAQARSHADVGRVDEAERLLGAAKDALAEVEYPPVATEVELADGFVLEQLGRYPQSEAALRRASESAARHRQWSELGEAMTQLVFVVGMRLQRPQDGLRYREVAAGLASRDARRMANLDAHVGMLLLALGEYAEAEAANRRALAAYVETFGAEHPHVAAARNNLAAVLWQAGKVDESEAEIRTALADRMKSMGPDHPDTVMSRNNLALLLMARGRLAEAESESRDVLAQRQAMYGPSHPEVAAGHNNVGLVLLAGHRLAEAEAEFRAGLAIRLQILGATHPSVAESRTNLGDALVGRGEHAEAIEQAEAAIAIWTDAVGAVHPHVAAAHHTIARAREGLGDLAGAEAEHRLALELREKTLGPDHPDVATSRADLADVVKRRAALR